MKEIEKKELLTIVGGASISGAIINAFNAFTKTIFSFGQSFGNALRRIATRKMCSCSK